MFNQVPHGVNLLRFLFSQVEQISVSELMSLLARTIEALSFVLLLEDYRLDELISR
jgi:hypothetical protein